MVLTLDRSVLQKLDKATLMTNEACPIEPKLRKHNHDHHNLHLSQIQLSNIPNLELAVFFASSWNPLSAGTHQPAGTTGCAPVSVA
jgi:hypothetical protein